MCSEWVGRLEPAIVGRDDHNESTGVKNEDGLIF
jgi:hypothetical protein